MKRTDEKISDKYRAMGVEKFYRQEGSTYRNPHEFAIRDLLMRALSKIDTSGHMLDLACGSGESTLVMEQCGFWQIDAIDPYTHEAYRERTGRKAAELTFEQIADGCLCLPGHEYDAIVCSFAMHLVDESRLPKLCYQLSTVSDHLIVITPIKRPEVRAEWGWSMESETMKHRVRCRIYRSSNRQKITEDAEKE